MKKVNKNTKTSHCFKRSHSATSNTNKKKKQSLSKTHSSFQCTPSYKPKKSSHSISRSSQKLKVQGSDDKFRKQILRLKSEVQHKKSSDKSNMKGWFDFIERLKAPHELHGLIESINDGYMMCIRVQQKNKAKQNRQNVKENFPLKISKINKSDIKDYHDQFMDHQQEFSPSWRHLLQSDMHKFTK